MIALLLMALAFPTHLDCRVQGDVYVMPGEEPTLTRTDGCTRFIRDRIEGGEVVLSDERFLVEIPLPAMGGHVAFAYKWGSSQAWFAGQPWPVAWTAVVRG